MPERRQMVFHLRMQIAYFQKISELFRPPSMNIFLNKSKNENWRQFWFKIYFELNVD